MPIVVSALVLAAASVPADAVVINGNKASRTYDCKGDDAVVNGNQNALTLHDCQTVTVNGNQNDVSVKSAATIMVSGRSNNVTWNGSKPKIVNVGQNNHVAAGAGSEGTGRNENGDATVDIDSSGVKFGDISIGSGGIKIRENPSASEPFVVSQDAGTITHDCKGGDAAISGSANTVRFVDCHSVDIDGDRNTVHVDGVSVLKVTGDENTVSWSASHAPEISNRGERNTIAKK
jgi:hypothetical protein